MIPSGSSVALGILSSLAPAVSARTIPTVQFYMLSLYWPQTTCEQHRAETGAGCRIPPAVTGWTVHGLWAQAVPVHPQNCSGPPLNLAELLPARPALLRLWPEVYADSAVSQFWQHEWEKHGTCTVAAGDATSQLDYFVRALELALMYDPGAALRELGFEPRPTPYSTGALLAALTALLPRRAIVKCERLPGAPRPLLSELRVCLDRQWRPADCYPADGTEIRSDGCDDPLVVYPPLVHTAPAPHWPRWLTEQEKADAR